MPCPASSGSASRIGLPTHRPLSDERQIVLVGELVDVIGTAQHGDRDRGVGEQVRHPLGVTALEGPHPRLQNLRLDPGEQLARRERLDQVVVGAGVQAFDARLLAGPRRQQDHRHRAAARDRRGARAAGRSRRARGIITSETIRSGAPGRAAASASRPSPTASTCPALRQQPAHVVAHVGVVVGEQDRGRCASGASAAAGAAAG